jgi:hypothetical protein
MLLMWNEQIFLLYYYLRSNMLDWKPTKEQVKDALKIEFGIENEKAIQDIYNLFLDNDD